MTTYLYDIYVIYKYGIQVCIYIYIIIYDVLCIYDLISYNTTDIMFLWFSRRVSIQQEVGVGSVYVFKASLKHIYIYMTVCIYSIYTYLWVRIALHICIYTYDVIYYGNILHSIYIVHMAYGMLCSTVYVLILIIYHSNYALYYIKNICAMYGIVITILNQHDAWMLTYTVDMCWCWILETTSYNMACIDIYFGHCVAISCLPKHTICGH